MSARSRISAGPWKKLAVGALALPLASGAVVVNDIERHSFPSAAISILGRITRNRLVGERSRRTVFRGFAPEELVALAGEAALSAVRVQRYFPFRLTLVAMAQDADTRAPQRPGERLA